MNPGSVLRGRGRSITYAVLLDIFNYFLADICPFPIDHEENTYKCFIHALPCSSYATFEEPDQVF